MYWYIYHWLQNIYELRFKIPYKKNVSHITDW